MANPLTAFVSPSELAEGRQVVEIEAKIDDFQRIAEIVETELAGQSTKARPAEWRATGVSIRLAFDWLDRQRGIPSVDGRLETRLPAVCQRCLELFVLPLAATFRIAFVAEGETDELIGVDAWDLADGRVRIGDLVEESLVMALPLAPVHPDRDACGPLAGRVSEEEQRGARPFADLRSQMDSKKR